MSQLNDQAEAIKKGVDQLIDAHTRGDTKGVYYWIGQIARQLTTLGRAGLGLEPLKQEGLALPERISL